MWGEYALNLKSIKLKNLTVFENLKVDLARGVNIFIGRNGTGKTHLLKAVYAACEVSQIKSVDVLKKYFKSYGSVALSKNGSDKIIDIFLESDSKNKEAVYVSLNFDTSRVIINDSINVSIATSSDQLEKIKSIDDYESYQIHFPQNESFSAVFIPSKDMLTHSKGLLAMSDKYREFPFDKTLLDIINKANQWTLKQPPKLAISILPMLEKMIDGTIVVENEEFFVQKKDGRKVNFAVEAEGLKKIGLLWQLLMNESIVLDSILIWDEPEANLNPDFIPKLVECILELSRQGVQIFVSTHNYLLAKYFDVRRKEEDSVMFHSLYKEDFYDVKVETKEYFDELEHNDILKSFDRLLDEVYELNEE